MLTAAILPLIILGSLLAGCASTGPFSSIVSSEVHLAEPSTTRIAKDTADWLARNYAPDRTTFALATRSSDPLAQGLTRILRERGFGVVDADPKTGKSICDDALPLRYTLGSLDNGLLLRLHYGSTEAVRLYARGTDGRILSSGPFTVGGR